MEEKTVVDLLNEIQLIAKTSEADADKTVKSNKSASVRLRKEMQKIKVLCTEIRNMANLKDSE